MTAGPFDPLDARQLARDHPGTVAVWALAAALMIAATFPTDPQLQAPLARWAIFVTLVGVLRASFVIARAVVTRLTQITAALTHDVPLDDDAPPLRVVDAARARRRRARRRDVS